MHPETEKNLPKMFWPWLILGLTTAIYTLSFANGFLWDDAYYLLQNGPVLSWTGLKHIWFHLDENTMEYYPITSTGFWLQHKLWGLHSAGYHIVSLILHILNSLLILGLLKKVAPRFAGITALLFAIHPIQVETVAWIAEQKNLWCLLFSLLAFHALVNFESGGGKKAYFKMLACFAASLTSKYSGVYFALVPLIYGWWKRGTFEKRLLWISLPLFFMGSIPSLLSIYLIHQTSVMSPLVQETSLFSGILQKILVAGRSFFFYIQQVGLPIKFMTVYPRWDVRINDPGAWLYPVGVIGLYTMLYRLRGQFGRGPFTLLFLYGISIFPMLGFIYFCYLDMSYVADHFSYLSVAPLLLLFCISLFHLFSKITASFSAERQKLFSSWGNAIILLAVLYLSFLSFQLTGHYKNKFTYWEQNERQNPLSPVPAFFLGLECLNAPEACPLETSIQAFEKALSLEPQLGGAYFYLGLAYKASGQYEKALRNYIAALEKSPALFHPFIHASLGDLHLAQNDPEKALPYLEKAAAYQSRFEYKNFRNYFLRLAHLASHETLVFYNLGKTHFLLGQFSKAAEAYLQAIRTAPGDIKSHEGLGASLMNLGDFESAARVFNKVRELDPANETARQNLAAAQTALAEHSKNPGTLPSSLFKMELRKASPKKTLL